VHVDVRHLLKCRLTVGKKQIHALAAQTGSAQCAGRAVPADDAVLVRIFHEVGDRHLWSAESWASWGSPLAKRHWLIDVDTEPGGLLTLLTNPTGDVEVVTFGLLPNRQGQGLGGAALTLAVDLAWAACAGGATRVWLHTDNFDHPSALPNYLRRGFAVVDQRVLHVEVPDGWHPPGAADGPTPPRADLP
jgi:GNAT superfamily N-acetyltransferase